MTLPEQTRQIKLIVAEQFGISIEDIDSRKRSEAISWPRHIAMYFARKKLRLTLISTGELFNRGHADVLHGIRRVHERARIYRTDRKAVRTVRERLKEAQL